MNVSPMDGVNDLLNTVMALKEQHRAHETANVEVGNWILEFVILRNCAKISNEIQNLKTFLNGFFLG